MCVIAYLPKEAKPLSREVLEAMWNTNKDGAGLMWLENDHKVHFAKGYFDFESLYRDYLIIKEDNNFECALHFRIATAGGINEKMCHPFPLTKSDKRIVKTQGRSDVCVMHNGCIPIKNRNGFSDTAEYIEADLYPRYRHDKRFFLHLSTKDRAEIKTEINGSRLLFFSKDGVEMVGNWTEYNGAYVSNTNFEWRLRKPKTKKSGSLTYLGNGSWTDTDYYDYWDAYDREYGYAYNKYDAFDDYYYGLMNK